MDLACSGNSGYCRDPRKSCSGLFVTPTSLQAPSLPARTTDVACSNLCGQAPEAQLGRVSKAGDIYSFGVTLWEM